MSSEGKTRGSAPTDFVALWRCQRSSCQNPTMPGRPFCWWHDPELAEQRAEARSKGGRARHGRKLGTTGAGDQIAIESLGDVLYTAYQYWSNRSGAKPMSANAFGRKMGDRFHKGRTRQGSRGDGVALNDDLRVVRLKCCRPLQHLSITFTGRCMGTYTGMLSQSVTQKEKQARREIVQVYAQSRHYCSPFA